MESLIDEWKTVLIGCPRPQGCGQQGHRAFRYSPLPTPVKRRQSRPSPARRFVPAPLVNGRGATSSLRGSRPRSWRGGRPIRRVRERGRRVELSVRETVLGQFVARHLQDAHVEVASTCAHPPRSPLWWLRKLHEIPRSRGKPRAHRMRITCASHVARFFKRGENWGCCAGASLGVLSVFIERQRSVFEAAMSGFVDRPGSCLYENARLLGH